MLDAAADFFSCHLTENFQIMHSEKYLGKIVPDIQKGDTIMVSRLL